MYGQPTFELLPGSRTVAASFSAEAALIGYQIFDPDSGTFILEGEWKKTEPGEPVALAIEFPPERGHYHAYVSALDEQSGWHYVQGQPFLLIDVQVESGRAQLLDTGLTTLRAIRSQNFRKAVGKAFTLPVTSIWQNRRLIQSMVRRDILARYRGSFGDVLWTVLNPLLLMATYSFVFGVVLQSRFGADNSRSGFVLNFFAGMLPWLAFSEAVGRAPHVMLEHRNFIRKLLFPVEILPVTQTLAALVTQAFATGVFLLILLLVRGGLPASALWLPVLLIPQVFFTLGTAWLLSALGVFMRDLGQIIGFLLTLWFFLTPICYPETSLPKEAAFVLTKNPIYVLVRGYRAVFLENSAPAFSSLWKLWLVAGVMFVLGYACFHKLRKSFADVI